MPLISVVIPTRPHESIAVAVNSLMAQAIQDLEIIVIIDHELRGQSWARNYGAKQASGKYILFSDADIDWSRTAIAALIAARDDFYHHSIYKEWSLGYTYCSYHLTEKDRILRTAA